MTPFKLTMSSGKAKILFSVHYSIISVLLISIYYCSFAIVIHYKQLYFLLNFGKTFKYTELSQIYLGLVTITVVHIMKYTHRDCLATHFEIAEQLCEIFDKLGSPVEYASLKIRFLFASSMQIVISAILLGISFMAAFKLSEEQFLPVVIVMVFPSYTIAFAQFMGTSLIYFTWTILQTLNEEVNKLLMMRSDNPPIAESLNIYIRTKKSVFPQIKKCQFLLKLNLIWKAYALICKNRNNINAYFAWTILPIVALTFINILFNIFNSVFMISLLLKGRESLYYIYFFRSVKCVVNVTNMFLLIIVCNICEKEVGFSIYPVDAYFVEMFFKSYR